jgi:DNA (cytosine-5)-methyltransferase 1
MMNERPKHIDLCTGIGGFSIAAAAAGFETVLFSEIHEHACSVLRKRFPRVINGGDARTIKVPAGAALLTAGFPCQDISGNGKGAGLAGERSGLYWTVSDLVADSRPAVLLLENVATLRTRGADEILADLASQDYAARAFVVGAWAAGAEHERNRAWIVAYDTRLGVEGLRSSWERVTPTLALPPLSVRTCDGEWEIEPDFRRTVHGVSDWTHRLFGCGNAIVPHVAYEIIMAIRSSLFLL